MSFFKFGNILTDLEMRVSLPYKGNFDPSHLHRSYVFLPASASLTKKREVKGPAVLLDHLHNMNKTLLGDWGDFLYKKKLVDKFYGITQPYSVNIPNSQFCMVGLIQTQLKYRGEISPKLFAKSMKMLSTWAVKATGGWRIHVYLPVYELGPAKFERYLPYAKKYSDQYVFWSLPPED